MTMKFYEDLTGELMTPILTSNDLWEDYLDYSRNAILNKQAHLDYPAFVQDLIDDGEIQEVHLSYEEIENLLTEAQNTIMFETYPVDILPNGKENPYYDDTLLEFTVPYSWYLKWVEKNGTTDDDFSNESTWDDTLAMYLDAIEDGTLIERHEIYRDTGEVFPKAYDLHLTIDDIDFLYYVLDEHCANLDPGYDYDRASFIREQIEQQIPNVKRW